MVRMEVMFSRRHALWMDVQRYVGRVRQVCMENIVASMLQWEALMPKRMRVCVCV